MGRATIGFRGGSSLLLSPHLRGLLQSIHINGVTQYTSHRSLMCSQIASVMHARAPNLLHYLGGASWNWWVYA